MARYLDATVGNTSTGIEFAGQHALTGLTEKITVPADAEMLFLTGCAAGGANTDATSADIYRSGGANEAYVGLSANSSCAFLHYHNTSYYTTSGILDPIGRKFARRNQSSMPSGMAGGAAVFLDNGVVVTIGGIISGSNNTYSLDFGANMISAIGAWAVTPYGTGCIAAKTVTPDTPPTDATVFSIAGGSGAAVIQGLNTILASNTYTTSVTGLFDSIACAGGYYMAAARYSTTTRITYALDTIKTPAGWTTITIDAGNAVKISAIEHNGSQFVAVGDAGKIYTAPAITGPWTARASNTTQNLTAIVWNTTLQRWLAIGNGAESTTSTDGITWTANATAFSGASKSSRNVCAYRGWFIVAGGSGAGTNGYYSIDGSTWATFISPAGANQIGAVAAVGCGVIIAGDTPSNCYVIRDFNAPIAFESFDTSHDGGQLAVRDATGKLRYYLAGGVGKYGGSSNGLVQQGSGTGMGGNAKTGHGGVPLNVGTHPDFACGGAGFPAELVPPAMYGIKLPGGNASDNTDATFSGAGASSFGFGGNGTCPGVTSSLNHASGPGAGMISPTNTITTVSGGGGESVVRAAIPVTPGETLFISRGLGSIKNIGGNLYKSAHGIAKLEY